MARNYFAYETKCRRCGELHSLGEWLEETERNAELFFKQCEEKIRFPPIIYCRKCEKHTLQDMVYYGREEKQEICEHDWLQSGYVMNTEYCTKCKISREQINVR